MIELFSSPEAWAALLTLTALEIVLGIDNVIFLSIITSRLPEHQQARARRIGLLLALAGRIILLFALSWLIGLTAPFVTALGIELSWRDLILAVGGLFLLYKATTEIHMMLEGETEGHGKPGSAAFAAVLVQIFLLDLVFSLDSVLTAIGMADEIIIMVAAIVIAIGVTFGMYAADPDGGWGAATGVGAMIGFWMSPLAGAVCGNGFHEVMKERAEKEDEATEVTLSHAHPVPA